jgi:hypothetical protein
VTAERGGTDGGKGGAAVQAGEGAGKHVLPIAIAQATLAKMHERAAAKAGGAAKRSFSQH